MKDFNEKSITRIELIDHTLGSEGREFVKYYNAPVAVEYDVQDDGQTLKIFVTEPKT